MTTSASAISKAVAHVAVAWALMLPAAGTLLASPRSGDSFLAAELVSQPPPRDEALWREIGALASDGPEFDEDLDYFAAALTHREVLLEKVRLYLAAYPGGRRRDEAVRLELVTLFEMGTLSGGHYEALRTQVEEYLSHPPCEAATHEAAYWLIHLQRLDPAACLPAQTRVFLAERHVELLDAFRAYVERYPQSKYVPCMLSDVFDEAVERGDTAARRRLVTEAVRVFPEHAVSESLEAQLQIQEAIGKPFGLSYVSADGTQVDTSRQRGRPILVVFWAAFSRQARAAVGEIELFRREHPDLCVVGVNLDGTARTMDTTCSELDVHWPQFHDGMGWASRLALDFGVREVPWVLVVDREGRLFGCAGVDRWREKARQVLGD